MNKDRKRRRLIRLWLEDCRCVWCRQKTFLILARDMLQRMSDRPRWIILIVGLVPIADSDTTAEHAQC
jgi:hypothetical protein